MRRNIFQTVSQPPTNPHNAPSPRVFDVADLYRGPATEKADAGAGPHRRGGRQLWSDVSGGGRYRPWATLREGLTAHQVVTVVLPTDDGRVLRIRKRSTPS